MKPYLSFPKRAEQQVMDIMKSSSDDQIIYTLMQLRTLIVLDAVKPLDKALFTSDLLLLESLYRGLKL